MSDIEPDLPAGGGGHPGRNPADDRLLLPEEVAEWLQVGVKWVYAAAQRGDLPHVKVGRYVRFIRRDVAQWVADHTQQPSA